MTKSKVDKLEFENAFVMFRNFSGAPGPFNQDGERAFTVRIEEDTANELLKIGWNVKPLKPRDGEPQRYKLEVGVGFRYYPAKVWLVSGSRKTLLDEGTVETLDWSTIKNADLVIRPYEWESAIGKGIKAQLEEGWFTIETNRFTDKYADLT